MYSWSEQTNSLSFPVNPFAQGFQHSSILNIVSSDNPATSFWKFVLKSDGWAWTTTSADRKQRARNTTPASTRCGGQGIVNYSVYRLVSSEVMPRICARWPVKGGSVSARYNLVNNLPPATCILPAAYLKIRQIVPKVVSWHDLSKTNG